MGLPAQKIVIVHRATRLQGLRRKFATLGQAEFLMEMAVAKEALRKGREVSRQRKPDEDRAIYDYKQEDETYRVALERLQRDLHGLLPIQLLEREMLPTYLFGNDDVVVAVGQDGLVANTAKYVQELPIVAVNPDPGRFDGILLPFHVDQARSAVLRTLERRAKFKQVTLAEAALHDGQRLLAFNDFFIGSRTHVSARYRLEFQNRSEPHSSSGVLVCTGAGSTGWLSSVFNMVSGVSGLMGSRPAAGQPLRLPWDDRRLVFVVREPFVSKASSASLTSGMIQPGQELVIESQMPANGVIFSDGIESDFLEFNSGSIVHIKAAESRARLVI